MWSLSVHQALSIKTLSCTIWLCVLDEDLVSVETFDCATKVQEILESSISFIPYSGKFSRGRNFRDQTPARENFFLPKFLADELRTPSTVCLSPRSGKSTENLS